MDKEISFVGLDISKFMEKLCDQFLSESPYMTDGEKKAYKLGISNVLGFLDQALNEVIVDESEFYHDIVVHVPGLNIIREYDSIDELVAEMKTKGEKK